MIPIAWALVLASFQDPPVDFNRDVRPLLGRRCTQCHGGVKRESGLSFAFRDEALAPAGSGFRAIVPGQPDESELLKRITSRDAEERMPPKGERLTHEEVATLRKWIASGAEWKNHWAFEPVERPALPSPRAAVRNGVDRFVFARLEREKLAPSLEADRAALLRRVAFTLTGLPPDPRDVEAFLADPAPEAYERAVERYLADPAYGERWGKLWLDAAGYADSNGYFHADTDRPYAWRYRDWVIGAVNADLPFDEFLRWQIAGDELTGYAPGADVTPEMVPKLVASHFLRNAPDGTGESDGNPDERQRDRLVVIESNLANIGSALLGLTLGCARCHDHPFEPVRQVEYYRLQAILAGAYPDDRTLWTTPQKRVITAATRAEIAAYDAKAKPILDRIKALDEALKKAGEEARRRRIDESVRALPDEDQPAVREILDIKENKRTEAQKKVLRDLKVRTDFKDEELPELAAPQKEAKQQTDQLRKTLPPELPKIAPLTEPRPDPPPHRLKKRGVYTDPGDAVPPGVPASLSGPGYEYRLEKAGASSGRRTALARWLTSPRHPLVARVTVNRVWQHHFGTGLVATPENLGVSGDPPSHADLLDYLAPEFAANGWSLKALHRLILTSATFRQSSAPRPEGLRTDPENRLLWRWPLRRLDAESIRDGMLAASGTLDPARGGPYVATKRTPAAVVADSRRRSVYLQQRRTQGLTFLSTFDAPIIVANCTRRASSTVPLQSLSLLNSDFSVACARGLGERSRKAGARVAFLAAWGRPPSEAERRDSEDFLRRQAEIHGGNEEKAWADFAQALLASNAFLYLE